MSDPAFAQRLCSRSADEIALGVTAYIKSADSGAHIVEKVLQAQVGLLIGARTTSTISRLSSPGIELRWRSYLAADDGADLVVG